MRTIFQATTVAVNEAKDDGVDRSKKQLKRLAIDSAALERLGLLDDTFKKHIKSCRRALHLERAKEKAQKTIIDYLGCR